MTLETYRRKRDFRRTPEPRGSDDRRRSGGLSFTVQKHAARRLHYDFRLEMEGALKSWAVPKGLSLVPGEKRLAVRVEDHPLSYGVFEGEIPEGEYGAGTVEIWDRGRWIPFGDPAAGLRRGNLKFALKGEKLKGLWALVRMKGEPGGKENWLLIKERDPVEKHPASLNTRPEISKLPPRAPRRALPEGVRPELATLVQSPPESGNWIHEIKFDGYRILCRIERKEVRFFTREGHDWTRRFPELAGAARGLPARQALLDGEVVVFSKEGLSSFQLLQNALSEGSKGGMVYQAFDLLYLDGRDLRGLALQERKKLLAGLLAGREEKDLIRYTDHLEGRGGEFYRQACAHGLEGIVSKRRDRPYVSQRTRDWVKVKCFREQEFIIAGFTDPEGARAHFGSLLLGVRGNGNGKLLYAGHVGTGFNQRSLEAMDRRLKSLETRDSPFVRFPESTRGVHWVKPELVAQVAFSNWTQGGVLRHPSFRGLREDIPAQEVFKEEPADRSLVQEDGSRSLNLSPSPLGRARRPRGPGRTVAGVFLSHPEKILYPEQGISKSSLALFYEEIADWILPHVADRPLSLVRCPSGQGNCFYQKHLEESAPQEIGRIAIREGGEIGLYPIIQDLKGLISLVQIGVLEIHPWGSRSGSLENPDRVVFDLDPAPEVGWERVIAAAWDLRGRLSRLGLKSYVKTTGGKGLHVTVPLSGDQDWSQAKRFSRSIAEDMARADPRRYTARLSKEARKGRIFLDYLRNGRGSTSVAPYSTRARRDAPVAAPVSWEELKEDLDPDFFNVLRLPDRLKTLKKDPWSGIFKVRQTLEFLSPADSREPRGSG